MGVQKWLRYLEEQICRKKLNCVRAYVVDLFAFAALVKHELAFLDLRRRNGGFRTYRASFAWNNLAIMLFEMDQRSI